MLLLEIAKADLSSLQSQLSESDVACEVIETDRFDGAGAEVVNVLVPLTTATLTAVTTIVVQLLRNRRRPKIKWRGVEISDISEANVMDILSKYVGKK